MRRGSDFILLLKTHWYNFWRTCDKEQIEYFAGFMKDYLHTISDNHKWKYKLNN